MSDTKHVTEEPTVPVAVWDLQTRLFHWALLALLLVSWLTGEEEGLASRVHIYAGEAIAALIVFRLVWGFAGGEHARFRNFSYRPSAIMQHIRDMRSPAPERHLGHNPLGGLAVLLMLLTITAIVITGLCSSSDERAGPFAVLLDINLSELHEDVFRVLQGLVALHLAGVAYVSWKTRDGLIPAMITGRKRRRADEHAKDAQPASGGVFALALGLAIVVLIQLVRMS